MLLRRQIEMSKGRSILFFLIDAEKLDNIAPEGRRAVAETLKEIPLRGMAVITSHTSPNFANAKTGPDHVTTPLHALRDSGQAVWLDFIERKMVRSGDLQPCPRIFGRSDVQSSRAYPRSCARG